MKPILRQRHQAFTLVEIVIAIGLLTYSLLAILGLMSIALSSSRESSVGTAQSQIVLQAVSLYDGSTNPLQLGYTYEGVLTTNSSPHFNATVSGSSSTLTNTPSNLQFLTISITSPTSPNVTNVTHATTWVP